MKLLLLKILLQRRAKDEGFTLPLVIALGLIMILLGAVNILSASEENLTAISTNQKNEALAIAEVGVARYRQFLDKNRMLSVYDSADWSSVANTCDIDDTITDAADNTNWEQVSNGTENIGQYRIVSYFYDIDGDLNDSTDTLPGNDDDGNFAPNDDNANTSDLLTFNDVAYDPVTSPNGYNPRGVLTIKSQANDGSEAQVEVEIPIRINEDDMTNLSPALWIGDSSITSPGTLILDGNRNNAANGTAATDNGDGNIVISKPATGTTEGCDNSDVPAALGGNNRVVYDPRPLPPIITEITDVSLVNNITLPNIASDAGRYGQFRGTNNQLESMMLLGKKEASTVPVEFHKLWRTDAEGFNYYFYKIPGLTINSTKLATDGQSRVVLYVDGDVALNNNASLQTGSKFVRGYKSVGLQVYVNGTRNIDINPNGGTVRIKGLIHAPNSTVNITSGGTVRIEGAMWVKNWNNTGGATVTIIPDNAGVGSDKAYQHYIGTDNRFAKPITNAPTDWEVQEVADEPSP